MHRITKNMGYLWHKNNSVLIYPTNGQKRRPVWALFSRRYSRFTTLQRESEGLMLTNREFEDMLRRLDLIYNEVIEAARNMSIVRFPEETEQGLWSPPMFGVDNPADSGGKIGFWKIHGSSEYWGVILSHEELAGEKKFVGLLKVSQDDLIKLLKNFRSAAVKNVCDQPRKRYTVIGKEVRESENGPFLSTGEITFDKIDPSWTVRVNKSGEPLFFISEEKDEGQVQQIISSYERKYEKYVKYVISQLV